MLKKINTSSLFSSVYEKAVKYQWFLSALLMTISFLLINYELVTGRVVGIWDVDNAYLAYQSMVADNARAGKFVLWDVWSNGGVPISGDPQVGAFSPLNIVIGLIAGGGTMGFRVYWLAVWWLGGLGIILLGYHLKSSSWGSAVVAIGYLFSGIYITNAEHTSVIPAYSLIPFIIWRLDAALCSDRTLPALQAGALWGLAALSGYPACIILTIFFCGLWAIGRVIFKEHLIIYPNDDNQPSTAQKYLRTTFRRAATSLALFTVIGVVVLAPTYFSFLYDGAGTTTRVGELSRAVATQDNPLHLGAIATFASPYIAIQKLYNGSYLWKGMDVSMGSIYAGAIVIVFALFALFNANRNYWRWWLIFLAALALACSLSQVFPLRGWLYDFVYPTRFFRHPSLFRAFYLFPITVLALYGFRDIGIALRQNSENIWENLKASSTPLAVGAILVFVTLINSLDTLGGKIRYAYLHIFAVWLGLCFIPHFAKRLSARKRIIILPAILCGLAFFDAFSVYHLSKPVMVSKNASDLQRWKDFDKRHNTEIDLTARGLRRNETACYPIPPCINLNNDQMIDKIPVFNSYSTQVNAFQIEMVKNPLLRKMAVGSERIWFSAEAAELAPNYENFAEFLERTEILERSPLILHSPQSMMSVKFPANTKLYDQTRNIITFPQELSVPTRRELNGNGTSEISNLPAVESVSVNVIKYVPEELFFEVECPADGWLLVTDRWARSWNGEVNGQSTPVYGGNFIFRAVKVSAGYNKIRFIYRTYSFPYLLISSWTALTLIAVVTLFSVWKNKKSD